MNTYKDLDVWKRSIDLVESVYNLTRNFPDSELYSLTSQMRRAAVSIPSNIAEGKLRGSDQQLKQFLSISFASGGELETQVEIAKRLSETKNLDYSEVDHHLVEVMKMLNVFINKLGPKS